jgi:hypothetical protein
LAVRDDRHGVPRSSHTGRALMKGVARGCGEAPPMRQNWPAAGRSS